MRDTDRGQLFVYGWFGQKNLGDEAILWSLIPEIAKRVPDVTFNVMSKWSIEIPKDMSTRVRIVHHSPIDVLRGLVSSRVLMFAGGTHVSDDGNRFLRKLWAHLAILSMVVISKLLRKKIALVCVGIGPLKHKSTRLVARIIIRVADYVSVRDNATSRRLQEMTTRGDIKIAFDPAVLLNSRLSRTARSGETRVVGVSILPYMKLHGLEDGSDVLWVKTLAAALREFLDSDETSRVRVFEFSENPGWGDSEVSIRLAQEVGRPNRVSVIRYTSNPLDLLNAMLECDYFLAMRYHSALFSLTNRIPTVVFAYREKCRDLAVEFGMTHIVVSPSDFSNETRVNHIIKDLVANPERYALGLPTNDILDRALSGIPDCDLLRAWTSRSRLK